MTVLDHGELYVVAGKLVLNFRIVWRKLGHDSASYTYTDSVPYADGLLL
jgi:hypothetical protein